MRYPHIEYNNDLLRLFEDKEAYKKKDKYNWHELCKWKINEEENYILEGFIASDDYFFNIINKKGTAKRIEATTFKAAHEHFVKLIEQMKIREILR